MNIAAAAIDSGDLSSTKSKSTAFCAIVSAAARTFSGRLSDEQNRLMKSADVNLETVTDVSIFLMIILKQRPSRLFVTEQIAQISWKLKISFMKLKLLFALFSKLF